VSTRRITGALWMALRRLVVVVLLASSGLVALELRQLLLGTAVVLFAARATLLRSDDLVPQPASAARQYA
jgi:hypothetical protein